MKKILIEEASDDQLKTFLRDVQQVDVIPSERGKVLAALVKSGYEDDFIIIESADAPDSDEPLDFMQQSEVPEERIYDMPKTGFGHWKNSPMVVCKIMPTDRPGGNEPAAPTINGSPPLVIQRNRLVRIPYDFYLVLKQAGGTKVVPGEKAEDDLVLLDYSEYPLSDVRLPPASEIRKWQDQTGAIELGHRGGRPAQAAAA